MCTYAQAYVHTTHSSMYMYERNSYICTCAHIQACICISKTHIYVHMHTLKHVYTIATLKYMFICTHLKLMHAYNQLKCMYSGTQITHTCTHPKYVCTNIQLKYMHTCTKPEHACARMHAAQQDTHIHYGSSICTNAHNSGIYNLSMHTREHSYNIYTYACSSSMRTHTCSSVTCTHARSSSTYTYTHSSHTRFMACLHIYACPNLKYMYTHVYVHILRSSCSPICSVKKSALSHAKKSSTLIDRFSVWRVQA
jgi:hypothetical protein